MIDTIPDILARIVAKKREDLARSVPPLEAWERAAELCLPAPSSGHRSRPSRSLYEYDVSSASHKTWMVA